MQFEICIIPVSQNLYNCETKQPVSTYVNEFEKVYARIKCII